MSNVTFQKFIGILLFLSSFFLLQACDEVEDEELPDPTVSLTDTYSVKYVSDMTTITAGKSTFTLRITEIATSTPTPGLTVAVMPMMEMVAGHMHDAPVTAVTDNGDGSYEATVYYLMPSSMNGTKMGDWELQIMIGGMGGEVARFEPDVKMAMNASFQLKGQADMIMGMNGGDPLPRTYFIFKDSLMGTTGNHSLKLFLAARESMMSHVALHENVTLNAGAMYEYLISPISVEVSTDETNWTAMFDQGDGNWTVTGLTGLTDGVQASIYIKLTIQGEQKTTNGLAEAGDGSNDYGVFTLTPGMTMSM